MTVTKTAQSRLTGYCLDVAPKMTPSGLLFPARGGNSAYLSRTDHRSFAVGERNKWAASCDRYCEYGIFCASENEAWRDSRPQLWGLLPGLPEIGSDGERLAKFPDPPNEADAWHGYPVSAQDTKRAYAHRPEFSLIKRWICAGLIDDPQAARIRRGKV